MVASYIRIQAIPTQLHEHEHGGVVMGRITDERDGSPIEYANIAVYSKSDSSLVTGGITDAEGLFEINTLKPGSYYATVKFIGYEMLVLANIAISREMNSVELGNVSLTSDAQNLNELDVVGDKEQILYKIDKKVVNPSQFLAAQGGSAVDILANTPSVSVDIEGNVAMRGSSNFMVLVNGKPTPFEASDALAQIPASSIDNIEIITNPSAKYDPDGAAGIINVITKKGAQIGWNGIVNASVNTLGSYSGNFLFNFTGDKTRLYLGASRSDRISAADFTNASGTIDDVGDTSHIAQEGLREMRFFTNSVKGGIDYDLNDKNSIGLELQGGMSGRSFDSDLNNREWTTGAEEVLSHALAESRAKGNFGSFTLSQNSQFGEDKHHNLVSSLFYQKFSGDDDTYSTKIGIDGDTLVTQETWEDGDNSTLRFNTDYTRPWENGTIEAGYQLRIDNSWSKYSAEFDTVEDNSIFYNEYTFRRVINSAYGTFSGESGHLGYKLGLRLEHTLRQLEDLAEANNEINRWDWYPTIHLSYDLNKKQSLMTSYTRRIDRPRAYYLDPYVMWRDPNNVRVGNPELQPQYTDSYELSYHYAFGNRNFFSAELFHRHVIDKIERTRSKYQDGVIMMAYDNVGEDYSTGLELMLKYNIARWWAANLSGSIYDYRIDVCPNFMSSVEEVQSNNFNTRLSNTFRPSQTLRIQFDASYRSESVSASGTKSDLFYTSLALKKSFFERKLDIGVSVHDVFNTSKMSMYTSGESYYSDYYFDMKSPFLQFTLTYVFKNYKPDRKKYKDTTGMEVDF